MANSTHAVIHEALNKMASSNSTVTHDCIDEKTGTYRIILIFIVLPLHIILIKVIAKDFQFNLPRHSILFSLSLASILLQVKIWTKLFVNYSRLKPGIRSPFIPPFSPSGCQKH